jgi:phosphatidylglycerol:prolipoprotein diacylglycerol transferase
MRQHAKAGRGRRSCFMIPFIEEPSLELGPISLRSFDILVCIAVLLGFEIVVRRAARYGIESARASSLMIWTLLWGFVASHLFDLVAYYPETIRENPLELLKIWASMSSFGGIVGGLIAAFLVMKRRGMTGGEMLGFADLMAFGFPFAWIFGRLGCSLAHDHMGIASQHWLAVDFPGGPRFDLGLLELFYTLVIAAAFLLLDRRRWPTGFFLGLFFTVYGPVRFALDMLRADDARYLGWTPGQFFSVATTLFGIGLLLRVLRSRADSGAPPASDQAGEPARKGEG